MKKGFGRMFLISFIKSFLFLLLLICVGFLSYKAVMHFLKCSTQSADTYEAVTASEKITQASVDNISKNLIYCTDKDNGEVEKILLEIFHCKNKKLYYITIPVKTQLTMSDSLYKRLMLIQPDIPQVIKLSSITKYFSADTVYDYGVLLVQDLLNIKISYYTVIPKDFYETIFTSDNNDTAGGSVRSGSVRKDSYPKEAFSAEYIRILKTIHTAKDLKNYLNKIYPQIRSNLSFSEKMNYFDSYCKTSLSDISFQLIPGDDSNSAYTVDKTLTAQLLSECVTDEAG